MFQGKKDYKTIFWSLRFHGQLFFRMLYVDVQRIWESPENVKDAGTVLKCAPTTVVYAAQICLPFASKDIWGCLVLKPMSIASLGTSRSLEDMGKPGRGGGGGGGVPV